MIIEDKQGVNMELYFPPANLPAKVDLFSK